MTDKREGRHRAWRCRRYALCLLDAARADLPDLPSCPCERFDQDPAATHLRDLFACRHLLAAILFPDVYDLFTMLMSVEDPRKKAGILKAALRTLHDQKRGIGRYGPRRDRRLIGPSGGRGPC